MKFLDKWERQLARFGEERFYLVLLAIMAAVVALVVTVLALNLHRNFLTIACDTAAFQNAIVNTLHGNWFRDTAYDGPNILGLHTTLVLLLIAPIYAVFPSADTLFILQIWGVYSTVIPLYLLALDLLRRPLVAFLIAAMALASPLLLHMAVSPFHPETWILAAVLWSCYFYRKNHALGFWVSLGFAVSCGEQAALIYMALGASLLLTDDGFAWRRRYGKFALTAGLAWLVLAVAVISPLMRHPDQHNLFTYNYSDWGIKSASGLIAAMAQDPVKAAWMLFNFGRWFHVVALVGPPLLLAFLSWRTLLLLAPFPLYFLMSDQEFFLYFHAYYYQFALFAGYVGLILFLGRPDMAGRLGIATLAATILVNVLTLCTAAGFYIGLGMGSEPDLNNAVHAAFDKIPADAGVYGPHRYSAYLSNREDMVMGDLRDENLDFKAMLDARFSTTTVHPEQIDYIVIDALNDQCGWRQGGNPETIKLRAANINRLIQSGQWQIFWTQADVVILKRVGK